MSPQAIDRHASTSIALVDKQTEKSHLAPADVTCTVEARFCKPACNDFQEGIDVVRRRLESFIGKRVTMDKDDGFTGSWSGPQRVSGSIVSVMHEGNFVASVQFDGEGVSSLSSASLMLQTTQWGWDSVNVRDDAGHIPDGKKYQLATCRAKQTIRQLVHLRGRFGLKDKTIVTLDGYGANRLSMEREMDSLNVPLSHRPSVITLELDPNVALAGALRFGRQHVRFTAGDFRMQNKRGHVCGIERAICLDGHGILTAREKATCVALYLDYCGSPPTSLEFSQLIKKLPNIDVYGVTVAKRQPNKKFPCKRRLEKVAPPLCAFPRLATYDHPRVVCDVYSKPLDTMRTRVAVAYINSKERRARVAKQREQRRALALEATRCVGSSVLMSLELWPNGPGGAFDGVQRIGSRLCFVVTGTYRRYHCTITAVMDDGRLFDKPECFFLSPNDVKQMQAACAPS